MERSLSQLAMDAPVALGGKSRRRAPQRPEYRDWTRTAVAIAHRAPKQAPLDLAIEAGLESGELPPENARIKDQFDGANYAAIARRHGISVRQVRRIVHGH